MTHFINSHMNFEFNRVGLSSLGPGVPGVPDFGRSVNSVNQSRRGKLCPPKNAGTPGFVDLPTTLL